LWKRIFKSIKAIRRKEIKTNVSKTDGFSIPLNSEQFYIKKKLNSKINKKQLLKPSKVILYVDTYNGLRVDAY